MASLNAMSSMRVRQPFRFRMVSVIFRRKVSVFSCAACHLFESLAFVKYLSPSIADTNIGATFSIIAGKGFVVKLERQPSPSASSFAAS